MPFYRFYLSPESSTPSDAAGLPDDEAALMHAYGFLVAGGTVSVWDGGRHVAQLWAERSPDRANRRRGTSPPLDG